jgi:hypothetical protein
MKAGKYYKKTQANKEPGKYRFQDLPGYLVECKL